MANHIFLAVSLDGYIADRNNSVDWLAIYPQEQGDDAPFTLFMDTVDAVVMGRNTFEAVLQFGVWPYTKPVFVLSKTLHHVHETMADKVTLTREEPSFLLRTLRQNGYNEIYIDGGKVVQSFMEKGLIDSMTLTHIPIVLGGGVPLFGALPKPQKFEHVHTQILTGGLVMSGYMRIR